jgi:flavin-dependent dehydrogenase
LQEVRAGFVIGADGAASLVRKSLFPEMKVHYAAPLRVCYKGSLDIEKDYIHWFFPKNRPRPRFDIVHKGDIFLVEGSGIRELKEEVRMTLESYGFTSMNKPAWKDGCLIPHLHSELFSGTFIPARENVLLVGDAACLFFPVTCEGIGSALRSGLLAADTVASTTPPQKNAAEIYLHKLQSLIKPLKDLYAMENAMGQEKAKNASDLPRILKKAYEETRRVF